MSSVLARYWLQSNLINVCKILHTRPLKPQIHLAARFLPSHHSCYNCTSAYRVCLSLLPSLSLSLSFSLSLSLSLSLCYAVQCLRKWGFRRCEDICWVKSNVRNPGKSQHLDQKSVLQNTKVWLNYGSSSSSYICTCTCTCKLPYNGKFRRGFILAK